MLLIPGRPQARTRNGNGRINDVADAYRARVERLARQAFGVTPRHPEGPVAIRLELYYAASEAELGEISARPVRWHLHSIPTGDTAPAIILAGLAGHLYAHAGQANPLLVERYVCSSAELLARFGAWCRRGAAVVRYD